MATCLKLVPRTDMSGLRLRSKGFEFERKSLPSSSSEAAGLARWLAYKARAPADGKKINWRHGFPATWRLIKYRFVD